MITQVFFPHLKRHLKFAKYFCCLPFEWNEAEERLSLIKPEWILQIVRIQLLQHLVFFLLQTIMTTFSPYSTSTKLQACPFTGIYGVTIFIRWNWDMDGRSMKLLNSCIRFERVFFKGGCKISFKHDL
jgi:hypothetical protein